MKFIIGSIAAYKPPNTRPAIPPLINLGFILAALIPAPTSAAPGVTSLSIALNDRYCAVPLIAAPATVGMALAAT